MKVDLSNGRIHKYTKYNLEKITELDISGNNLIKLPRWISKCINLQKLDCSINALVNLPDNLPDSLQTLSCSNNNLVNLPDNLPDSLQELYCFHNKLDNLPENLPDPLQELHCYRNNLVNLPNILPRSLEELHCYKNKLVNLPDNLPGSLQILGCHNNRLVNLPENLPRSLQELYCSDNKLVNLPNLPDSLEQLDCTNNKLTSLPISIINCRNLTYIDYEDNQIEYIPPVIRRVLNRQMNRNLTVYNDTQSVHNHNIQESIKRSIYNLLGDKCILTAERLLDQITNDNVLNNETKESLIHYFNDNTEHSVLSLTFADLLVPVWERIVRHENSGEIKRVLNSEMNDALCKCFTGRISRLVNCLNGFYPDIEVRIGDNEQIGNIITVIKEAMGGEYDVDRHRALVRKELEERDYSTDVINEWISFIE